MVEFIKERLLDFSESVVDNIQDKVNRINAAYESRRGQLRIALKYEQCSQVEYHAQCRLLVEARDKKVNAINRGWLYRFARFLERHINGVEF